MSTGGGRVEWKGGRVDFQHEFDLDNLDELTFENEFGQRKARPFSGKHRSPTHSATSYRSSRPTSAQFWGAEGSRVDTSKSATIRKRQLYRRVKSPVASVKSESVAERSRRKGEPDGRSTFFSQVIEGGRSPSGRRRNQAAKQIYRAAHTDTNGDTDSWSPASKSMVAKQRLQEDVEHLTNGRICVEKTECVEPEISVHVAVNM